MRCYVRVQVCVCVRTCRVVAKLVCFVALCAFLEIIRNILQVVSRTCVSCATSLRGPCIAGLYGRDVMPRVFFLAHARAPFRLFCLLQ